MRRPTIQDVARLSGVSIATVSRCLHLPDAVAPATRDRVLAAVRSTGYHLNTAAQSLRQRRSNAFLVVVPDIGNTFFAEILRGIQAEAAPAGLTMLIADTGLRPEREAAYVRYLLNGRADGALLLITALAEWFDIPSANAHGIRPVVSLAEVGPEFRSAAVSIDNEAAACAATDHLIALGHRRIAHLVGPDSAVLSGLRRDGYRRALAQAAIPLRAEYEIQGDFSLASGHAAFDRLSKLVPRPTAIFCSNDEMAIGFIAAAHGAGVAVPREISVMGFDDIHFAQASIPALSTIRQPRAAMGAAAMRNLLAIWANETPAPIRMPYEVILRGSTSAVPAPAA